MHQNGVDLIEIDRIKVLYRQATKNHCRHLTKNEQHKFNNFTHEQRKIQFLAGRFATKEAFSKALGTGFGGRRLNDIDCYNDELGKPKIDYKGSWGPFFILFHAPEHYAMSQVVSKVSILNLLYNDD